MKRFKYRIRNFFGFSKEETNGFLLLLALMSLLLVAPSLTDVFYQVEHYDSSGQDKAKLDSIVAILEKKAVIEQKHLRQKFKPSLFYFNPNTATESDLQKILGQKVARTVIRFRDKGGKFYIKKDLAKIYGVDSLTYVRTERFIQLPDEVAKKKYLQEKNQAKVYVAAAAFDINQVDSLRLLTIRGIGKVLSARIVKYRNRLGGFISKDQYQEVYGLDTSVIAELRKVAFISSDFVPASIPVNKATFSRLSAHPYIGKKYANAILNYRQQHGDFTNMKELLKILSIPPKDLEKMMPYLSL